MAEIATALGDAARKAAKDKFKEWADKNIKDRVAAKFVYEMFDNTFDLVQESIVKGGIPSKTFIASYFAAKASAGIATLTDQQKVQCVTAIVNLGTTVVRNPGKYGGPVGWAAYFSFVLYDGLGAWEECSLALKDMQGDAEIREFKKLLEGQRAARHAQMRCEVQERQQLSDVLDALIAP